MVGTALLGLSGIIWQWREAVVARIDAQAQAKVARDEAELANRRLYDVKMKVAQRAWEDWNSTLLVRSLDDQRPQNQKGVDRRGFEWYYWQRKLGSGHQTIKGDTALSGVAFSRDGSRVAAAGSDYTVKVWDVATGQQTLTLRGHTGTVSGVAFSPVGTRLASAGGDGTVKLWNTATGREVLTIKRHAGGVSKGHIGTVNGVAFSPDGSRVASGVDETVQVWETASGRETLTLKGHTGDVESVAFSPDGSRLASAGSDAVEINPDGSRVVDPSGNATVKVWDLATGRETLTIKLYTGLVNSVAFSPDGSRVATAGTTRQ